MNKSFGYLYVEKFEKTINIKDVGNTCLVVSNDSNCFWYLYIETDMGWTFVKTFGPINADKPKCFNKGFSYTYRKIAYKESQLSKIIDIFINDPKKMVTDAEEIEVEVIKDIISNIDFMSMR